MNIQEKYEGQEELKRLKVDLVDEHYYRSPEWFLNQAARYDAYDRKGPKGFNMRPSEYLERFSGSME